MTDARAGYQPLLAEALELYPRFLQRDGTRSLALVLLLGFNGLRISEALGANVDDLGTERGHRVVRVKRKGGKSAAVPLAPRTAEAIEALVGDRTIGALFATASGGRWDRSEAWRTLRRLAPSAYQGRPTLSTPMTCATPL